MHDKPLVLLDPHGHYDGLRRWLDSLVPTGYVAQAALDRLVVVDDVDAALNLCAGTGRAGGSPAGQLPPNGPITL
jgi:predicted Rossmann-fold nucleotide-binding protein